MLKHHRQNRIHENIEKLSISRMKALCQFILNSLFCSVYIFSPSDYKIVENLCRFLLTKTIFQGDSAKWLLELFM